MKAIKLVFVTMLFVATIDLAGEQADRPAGISKEHWIQMSERLGFVLDEQAAQPAANLSRQILLAPPEHVSAELLPPAKGYFVVKTSEGWRRIAIAE
jgi:hypothetical protein